MKVLSKQEKDRIEQLRLMGRLYQDQIDAMVAEATGLIGNDSAANDLICNRESLEHVLRHCDVKLPHNKDKAWRA